MKPCKLVHQRNTYFSIFIVVTVAVVLFSSCSMSPEATSQATLMPEAPPVSTSQNLPMAMVTFEVAAPGEASTGSIGLELLDEVTGLAMNPKRYPMVKKEPGIYTVEVPITIGSAIKYRYLHQGQTLAVEYTSTGVQVRYRMAIIHGTMVIRDNVAAWTNFRYTGMIGRVTGQVVIAGTNTPVPSALVICAGSQTLTASDGTFLLEGIIPGTHNLVVYSMDGSFVPFQQGASVAENASTPAFIQVSPTGTVKVTFNIQIPESNIEGLPVRMVGNIAQLGNTFSDQEGGFSVLASRAPLMKMVNKGIYSITLELPVGLDLHYKYTLGDGFWNAEHSNDGLFRLRQLIIPSNDCSQNDLVDTWQSGELKPVIFSVKAPDNTPKEDIVSIQFNPFVWSPPLPMWPIGDNRWVYVLYSPLDSIINARYRYCRNDQCSSADDIATAGASAVGRALSASEDEQTLQDIIERWIWWDADEEPTTIIAPDISPRGGTFVAGVEFSRYYRPIWQPYMHLGIQNARQLGANWLLLSPTWHYTRMNPVVIEAIPGADPLWQDIHQSVQSARENGLQVGLFPRLVENSPESIWQSPIEDYVWWQNWYDRYRLFVLNFADLAEQSGAQMLILGGSDVLSALPGGLATNGLASGVPVDATGYWAGLIREVRSRYGGQIAWALPYPQGLTTIPEWLSDVDMIYVLFSAQLSGSNTADEGTLQLALGDHLDRNIFPIHEQTGIPIVIGIDYPSADGAATACILVKGECVEFEALSRPEAEIQEIATDLDEQRYIYGAAFNAVYQRDWLAGLISRGYYPPASLQDQSSSIHGKPAADIVWYWFPKLLGQ